MRKLFMISKQFDAGWNSQRDVQKIRFKYFKDINNLVNEINIFQNSFKTIL